MMGEATAKDEKALYVVTRKVSKISQVSGKSKITEQYRYINTHTNIRTFTHTYSQVHMCVYTQSL